MSEHSNAARLADGLDRLAGGDLDGFLDLLSADALVHVPGSNHIAGDYRGRNEIGDLVRCILDMSQGSFRLEPMEILADDRYVMAFLHVTAEKDREPYDTVDATALKVDAEGRFSEYWWLPSDQAKFNTFWVSRT
jgi:ketosteroid isomerase-like protein